MDEKAGAKEKLLDTVVGLLLANQDASKVSIRKIAAMAGVNSALINYYFQSKENLVGMAAGICIRSIGGELKEYQPGRSPAGQLKELLKQFTAFCLDNSIIVEIAIRYNGELKRGSTYTSGLLLPILKAHFGETKTDFELKLLTLQLLNPMQLLFMSRNEYQTYLCCDLSKQSMWDEIIDTLVDNLLGEAE